MTGAAPLGDRKTFGPGRPADEKGGRNMSNEAARTGELGGISVRNLNLFYGESQALKNVNMDIYPNEITAFIGPSGCGKSTFLKTLNRMNDLVDGVKITGEVRIGGQNIYDPRVDVTLLRKAVGMVFQKPNPFPMSIYDNIAYGPRCHGIKGARALAVQPDILLMDEPTSALDPISTMKIEELMSSLKERYTVVIVTHNMQQASRISDRTAFFLLGEMVEYGETEQIFSMPQDKRTEEYITGRFG